MPQLDDRGVDEALAIPDRVGLVRRMTRFIRSQYCVERREVTPMLMT